MPQEMNQPFGPREELRNAINELPEELKDVVVLHYQRHLNYNQISATLGIPWVTVQGRLSRARKRLRAKLLKIRDHS